MKMIGLFQWSLGQWKPSNFNLDDQQKMFQNAPPPFVYSKAYDFNNKIQNLGKTKAKILIFFGGELHHSSIPIIGSMGLT